MTQPDAIGPAVPPLAFAPIHKLALGVAGGIVFGLLILLLTLLHVVSGPEDAFIGLLSAYFYGYSVSFSGALIGGFWGFVTGFVAAWFGAFVRNLAVTLAVFALRTRAELSQTSDFLDHI
jgi:hypothetical protein